MAHGSSNIGINTAGTAGGGGSGFNLGGILGGAGNLLGGLFNQRELSDTRNFIQDQARFNPLGAGGFGGQVSFGGGGGQFQGDAQTQLLQQLLGGAAQQGFGGGLFQNQNFQNAFQGNDIFGALQQAQGGLQQQAGNTAFGGLGGLFGQSQGLSNLFAQSLAGGPQDFTGGLQQGLFGAGAANLGQAGDVSGQRQQQLDILRQQAAPQQQQQQLGLENRLFAQGRLGSTGGSQQFGELLRQQNQADLGFQQQAFGQGLQQQQFLGQLGLGQIGQGAGLLGQNLGQFNQQAQLASLFGQQAGGFEGQQFGQSLQSLQQNQSAGNQRLQNALGLFGQGVGAQNIGFGQGIAAQQGLLSQNQFGLDAILGLQASENARISAAGQSADALANLQSSSGGGIGGLISGIGSLAGLFSSDKRLKNNIKQIGVRGDFNWYQWTWNQIAIDLGIDVQPTFGVIAQEVAKTQPDAVKMDDNGYLQVNYARLV